jgi:DNA-binding IclR family transcriptional regulator
MSDMEDGLAEVREAHTEVSGAQGLSRGTRVLSTLAQASEPMAVAEIAEHIGAPESTAYRVVQALEESGLVERRERGRLVLGLRLLDLGRVTRKSVEEDILQHARPAMQALSQKVEETVILTAQSGQYAICLESVEGPRAVRLSFEWERALPLYGGASGKVLLAYLRDRIAEQIISAADGVGLANGIRIRSELLAEELAGIRSSGYCITEGEVDQGVTGVAAPIFGSRGRLVAGITVAGPSHRFVPENRDRMVEETVKAAQEIGGRLRLE